MTLSGATYPPFITTWNTTRYAQPTVQSATPTAWTTGNSPITLYTVTGTILCRCYGVSPTLVTSTSNNGTLAVGVASNTAVLLPATTADGSTKLIANAAWVDATPTVLAKVLATGTTPWVLLTGNIILTIATNSMTAGAVNLYLDWIPVSAGATVVSGSP